MVGLDFTLIAIAMLGFALVSQRLSSTSITLPMVFTFFGFLIGERFLNLVEFNLEHGAIHTLAEVTLILVLFADATRIDLMQLRREQNLPVRMLLIGLPLTIALGTVVALPFFGHLGVWGAAVLATMLAPTDAALGQVVVSSKHLPVRIRQTLNVESGLNDGMVLPILLLLLSIAGATEARQDAAGLLRFTLLQITLGPAVGVAIGFFGGKLVETSTRAGWITHGFEQISAIGLALLAFGAAELVGGNGFIAAFFAGMTLGNTARPICTCLYEFAETEGELLTLFVFMIFGAIFVPDVVAGVTLPILLYVLLSLTVIRMIPVAISLLGIKLQLETVLFLGWFGPRGLATVLFGLLVLEESQLTGREEVMLVAMTTVLLSIFAHGLTAAPLARAYAQRVATMQDDPTLPELMPVEEMPLRSGMVRQ